MSLLVLCLFLLYSLLNTFRATLCPSSGADDLEVFIRCVAQPWLCRQLDSVSCLSVHWEALNTVLPNEQTSNQPDLTAYTATALQHIS